MTSDQPIAERSGAAGHLKGPGLVDRLGAALELARRITRERGEAEARIASAWSASEGDAVRVYERSLAKLEEALEEQLSGAARDERAALDEVERTMGGRARQMRATYDKVSRQHQSSAAAKIAKVKATAKEAIWVNETMIESDRSQAGATLKAAHEQAVVRRTKLDGLRATLAQSAAEFGGGGEASEGQGAEGAGAPGAEAPEAPIESRLSVCEEQLEALGKSWATTVVRRSTMALVVGLAGVVGGGLGWYLDGLQVGQGLGVGVGVGLVVGAAMAFGLRRLGRGTGRDRCGVIARSLEAIGEAIEVEAEAAGRRYEEKSAALDARRDAELKATGKASQSKLAEIERARDDAVAALEREQLPQLLEAERAVGERADAARAEGEGRRREAQAEHDKAAGALREERDTALREAAILRDHESAQMREAWMSGLATLRREADALGAFDDEHWPDWSASSWESWAPPMEACQAALVARIGVDLEQLEGGLPGDPELTPAGPTAWRLPVALEVPRAGSLLLKCGKRGRAKDDAGAGRREAVALLRSVMLRYLTCLPPGKARFTIIDPVSLGQDFAGFMHLADYNEAFVTHRIWTEPKHIEQRLTELTEHMESVIQSYLRNQFETIADYNEQAGEIAEPYRFLVISGFPVAFEEPTCRRLASIIASGARCGVYTLIAMDRREELPNGISVSDIEEQSLTLAWGDGRFVCEDESVREWELEVDEPPSEERLTQVVRAVGDAGQDATRVEVPFEAVSPGEAELWGESSAKGLAVPLGRAGATKLQRMALGRGTAQHALIAGKTGSGKSTLLHVLITNLALWYSPDEVEFYLVDFKKGVEFKTYALHDLPHARAIAIESDREFGLSVLKRVDAELKRRGDLFRDAAVQDLAAFRAARPEVRTPRTLLVIDEFQELFVEDDSIAGDAALLLDRLVRQGRAFGIHVILGSQTLGGAYSLARSTMGQMGVRVALQCSEADSYLIMNEDNAAARLLTRPGEAIYNDASGLVEGNSPFQIVWLPEGRRERALGRVRTLARERTPRTDEGWGEPAIVFEGNAPADLGRNGPLQRAIAKAPSAAPAVGALAWLGDAVAIKEPTACRFTHQSGSNLLIVSQQDEAALGIALAANVGLAAQYPEGSAMFYIVDPSNAGDSWRGATADVVAALPQDARRVEPGELLRTLIAIAGEVDARVESGAAAGDEAPVFLTILAAQRLRDLRRADDFGFSMDEDGDDKADKLLARILREGAAVGVHVIAWCDTMSAAERLFDRQAMREFDGRVAFQMSASDSTTLIDTPAASRLGPHRALFYSEEAGTAEVFRPYRAPDAGTLGALWSRRGEG